MPHHIALLGFGVVGQGLAEILLEKEELLRQQYGLEAKVVAISDLRKGSLFHPEGLRLEAVMNAVRETGTLEQYPEEPGLVRGWDSCRTILESNADTVVEMTYTDVATGQPAIDHCKLAFESGKNVVMSNKGPVALAYSELSALAKKQGVRWGFEGTVMSGTPAIRMPLTSLAGNQVREIKGILNGTTNYMLSQMSRGQSYQEALQEAQRLGYAEADPTSDVEGYDAVYKTVILANVVMNVPLARQEVSCRGITGLTPADMERAREQGKCWKLISRITQHEGGVAASVAPEMLPLDDPLAGVNGADNAITYYCDLIGPVTITGAGAGRIETGFSLLIDLINIQRGQL